MNACFKEVVATKWTIYKSEKDSFKDKIASSLLKHVHVHSIKSS